MEADPFDHWYSQQIDDRNFRPGDWNFYTVGHDAGSAEDVHGNKIDLEQVDSWVDQQAKTPSKIPGLDLLVVGNKYLGRKDVNFRLLPFRTAHFRRIFERLQLPVQFFHLRTTGGAQSGATAIRTHRDEGGRVSRIAFVIRPAHSSVTEYGSFWAFAFTWNALTRRTIGYLDGISESDLNLLKDLLKSSSHLLSHPLTLPEILLHMVTAHLNENLRIPNEENFFEVERATGLARVVTPPISQRNRIWNWDFKAFQDSTTGANQFITTLSYVRRRLRFAAQLTNRLLSIQEELRTYQFEDPKTMDKVKRGELERKERFYNRLGMLENYEHQTECMQKRAENLITVLYTVLSQIDSRQQGRMARINLQIAQAVRSDSIPMRTIAYVTLVFLPGAFIATIFGMNFFLFDPNTRKLVIAHSFWQYWAVTIPVTAFVLGLWNYWVYVEKRDGDRKENEARTPYEVGNIGGLEMSVGDIGEK